MCKYVWLLAPSNKFHNSSAGLEENHHISLCIWSKSTTDSFTLCFCWTKRQKLTSDADVALRKGANEAMSCLNMNECCVNASAVIFRQEQIPVCCCCVFSCCSRECCCCYGILQGGKTLKCEYFSRIHRNPAETLYLHLQHF